MIVYLHMMQLEGYRNKRYIKWLLRNRSKVFMVRPIKKPKKKLVFTARATRLFIADIIILSFLVYFILAFSYQRSAISSQILIITATFFLVLVIPLILVLSNALVYPVEAIINGFYVQSAKRRIKKLKPKVVAITGSYGKTSTKDFLDSLLSARYRVLKTPGSFNTPMGICKVIRGELRPEHEIFVVELGAREEGNIKQLCDLVKPYIGVITAIGPQHLEMFKTIENIMNTKYELIDSLPDDGVAVFNNDDEYCRNLADRTRNKKVLRYGIQDKGKKLYLMARDISVNNQGIHFSAQNSKGRTVPFHCRLLGRHTIYNLLAASTVALELGMSLSEIAEAAKSLNPSPHRLNIIQGGGGVTVIDDAFNANPVGARMALEVLGELKGARKILVTPGLIELGDKEYEENRKLGAEAAKVCDMVFLVGPKRTRPIVEGLKESGFEESKIFVEKSLNVVTSKFKDILKTGDVILFENDLPDTYNE